MFFNILEVLKNLFCFTGSYSNDVFLDPLSSEDEEKYINKMLEGDKLSRNKLIEHNLRLVAHIVKKFDKDYQDNDDLISIGTIGLIKGVDSYSKERGVKITTYCARCIENEILMYFRTNNKHLKDVSLNDYIGYDKDGNEISIIDILKVEDNDFTDEIELKDNIKLLKKYMKVLNNREKKIISRRYGLDNKEEETQKDIANTLGISRSYVSRIEKRALTKLLKEFIKNKKIDK
ncbi:MAG: RNA polymerase sporulation sigma factor SigK [Bacilli bacterium]|nr:RNA polymerase sporulation sigma factor SigK [Bacilli bacterium]